MCELPVDSSGSRDICLLRTQPDWCFVTTNIQCLWDCGLLIPKADDDREGESDEHIHNRTPTEYG
jgi:hypothetical protein